MNRKTASVLSAAVLVASSISGTASSEELSPEVLHNLHAFDFIAGKYRVHNRRLAQRLRNSREWIEFEATNDGRLLLNGFANEDEFRTDYWQNFIGMTFRFFDPKQNRWSIYWMDTITRRLDPPVVGSFVGSTGTFVTDDVFDGKPIVVRFIWSRTDTSTPRWEQAFSPDGGKTWETNWIMDFRREQ
jgi:hypothetical protein